MKIAPMLNVWYSRVGYGNTPPVYFQKQDPVQLYNGSLTLNIQMNELWTFTTLNTGFKGSVSFIPEPQPFPLPYIEKFESYNDSEEAFNFAQQVGSFEIDTYKGTKCMKQAVIEEPVNWFYCQIDKQNTTLNVIGDYNWKDIHADVNVAIPIVNGTDGVYLAVRATTGGCRATLGAGLFFFVYPKDKHYVLSADLLQRDILANGLLGQVNTDWNNLALTVKGSKVEGYLNSNSLFNVTTPVTVTSGWVAVGTYPYGLAYFDDFFIYTV